ncbi:disulfide bond formation protein B [Pontixanthobacter aestiaquae]|uniref:Disulfide bond formation protein B n=1 Tax=Pontixanthobacter aestiaquae TaxID=1509367 RepID=A0A844Z5H9_9SPHN|nr:disulfide bond formation protein B [Pontixanthobacter aestiaquae]MDN3646938.1 disulfide bond formation protein B [Pontixanthobacter aestiaquae]MXO82080.1 disulfide bond formation protein B [Pontixanthobacter aestiaquae]
MIESPHGRMAQRLALAIPALLLGGAYISEYVFGLFPCEMCWWQRWPHFAALGFAALSIVAPPKRVLVTLSALAMVVSGLIGGFHAGVEYGWWEGITDCAVTAAVAGVSAVDAIMTAPIVRCDKSPWDLFGISLAGWNFLISCGAGCANMALLFKGRA